MKVKVKNKHTRDLKLIDFNGIVIPKGETVEVEVNEHQLNELRHTNTLEVVADAPVVGKKR